MATRFGEIEGQLPITGGATATFKSDGTDRRYEKTVSGTATGFLYDGLNPVHEMTGTTTAVKASLMTGSGLDQFFARSDAAGTASMLSDALGSTIALTDANGAMTTQYTYEAYGKTTQNGAASESAFQYTGRENDGTGLYYYRARYYDPAKSRFIGEDPIGLAGGSNAFSYVEGNPLNRTDPTGRFAIVVPFIPAIITGVDLAIGAGLGLLGYGLDRMFNDATPPRGLPPEGVQPPIPEADQCKPGPASRPSERDKGGQSLWDPNGGEWRWFPGDKWHNPHWDHNAHDGKSSPWVNVPHGGLPPVKK